MRFHALNESSASGDEDGDPELVTREAQEEEAYSMYNAALKSQSQGNLEDSEDVFQKILLLEFIAKAQPQDDPEGKYAKEEKAPLCPALNLKYLVFKNLAVIANKKKNYHSSVASYLEALNIDSTDVNLWYHTGITALNLPNYSLSRLCFEEGLKRNPNHWPCLDHVITVTYALNDYANCLYHISRALEIEASYLKGLVFKDQIFKEDPSLRTFCESYFEKCDPSIYSSLYDKDEADELIQESLKLREKNRSLYKPSPLPVLKLNCRIKEFTWKALGESLVSMYEYITTANPVISLSCKIDLSEYLDSEKDMNVEVSTSVAVSSSEGNCSTAGKQCKIGLLQMAPPQDSSAEKDDRDDSPNGSGMSILSTSFMESLTESEPRPSDPLIYSDAPLGNRKPPKRKRSLLSELSEFCGKRRSTRVRNPALKRPQDNINYQEILQQFIPPRLMDDSAYDEQDDTGTWSGKHFGDHTYGQTAEGSYGDGAREDITDENCLASTEKQDVEDFIVHNQDNGGLIALLYKYVTKLGARSNCLWPKMLPDVFSSAFIRLRKHITMPNLFCYDTEKEFTKEIGFAVLAFSELKVDQWYLSTGHSTSSSLSFSPKMPSTNPSFQIGPDSIGKNFHSDMEFLMQLTVRRDVLDSTWLDFTIRALWLKAKFHSVEGEVDMAVSCMERLSDVLQKECQLAMKVVVANSFFSNVITLATVQQQLESLQRCQSLEEIQRLYESGAYQSVVDLLVVTFGPTHSKPKISPDGGIPERHAQLMLLQDSLWKLENYQECVKWTEVAFKEAIQQYMNASGSSAKSDWTDTMAHLLSGLERCVKVDKNLLNGLEHSKLVRLCQNLILIICLLMDTYDVSVDSALTVLPWIVLYRLVFNEELREKAGFDEEPRTLSVGNDKSSQVTGRCTKIKSDSGVMHVDADSSMPSSLLLIITAHECLGRRSSCCASDGLFLLHCVDIIMEKLQESSCSVQSYREDLENALEQAFYCLYGHPHKRTKAKHLQEHNSQQISLTWERAPNIYYCFKPQILPEFDSYRTSTVSAELENLLKRIAALVPLELDPSSRVDAYSAYIEGGTDKCPTFPADVCPNPIVQDLYYLLADYYFKNKEFSKAIRYYLMDVCINPDRLDSWAGMALSRSSQLDQKLNSYEVRNESTIWRKASAALRCFEHALQLDTSTNSLWIEYGSLAYVLHSHASRQLKLNTYFDGPRELLKVKKDEMLLLAERCFKEANKSVDNSEPEEAWLHHYMLGKISQKVGKPPSIFLDHYQKSLRYLHEDRARYPHKIQYHNPPELSIEVLEVFYRIHATCLKFLSKYESTGMPLIDLKVYHDCLSEVAVGPFSMFQEKIKMENDSPSYSECDPEDFSSRHSSGIHGKSPTDHNYFNVHMKAEKVSSGGDVCSTYNNEKESVGVSSKCSDSELPRVVSEVVEYLVKSTVSSLSMDFEFKPLSQMSVEQDENMPELVVELNEIMKDCSPFLTMHHISPNCGLPVETPLSRLQSPTKLHCTSDQVVSTAIFDEVTEDDFATSINNLNDNNLSSSGLTSDVQISDTKLNLVMDDVVKTLNEVIAKVLSTVNCTPEHTLCLDFNQKKQTVFASGENKYSECKLTDLKCFGLPIAISDEKEASSVSCSSPKPGNSGYLDIDKPKADEAILNSANQNDHLQASNDVKEDIAYDFEETSEKELEESKVQIEQLISDCLNGLRECLKRFIQHYKSLYRIADYYCNSVNNRNLQWAREVLLAATPAVKNYPSMPGLFAERKNTNFFNGIWRAPSNEIDRPGSFGAHMYRSVRLLIDVLTKQSDYNMLLYLTQQLYRNPDLGKKYMRDVERISLARQAYDSCVTILREQMNSLLQEEPPPEESRLTCCLLEIYRTFQTLLKGCIYVDDTNELLEEAYRMYKFGEVDPYPSVLDQAIMFCQLQLGKSYQVSHEAIRLNTLSKQAPVITDTIVDGNSKISTISGSMYTPDAWQKGKRWS